MAIASAGLGLMPALLFRGGKWCSRLHPQRRSGMQRPGAAKTGRRASSASARTGNSGPSHDGLAGTNGTAINGLAGDWRGATRRHAGPWRLRLCLARGGTCLLQPRHHIRAGRNHRTRGGLASQIGAGWRGSQRHGRRWSRSFHGGRRRRTGRRMTRCRVSGGRRCGRCGSSGRQRLARSREYLTRPWRGWYRTRRYGAGA